MTILWFLHIMINYGMIYPKLYFDYPGPPFYIRASASFRAFGNRSALRVFEVANIGALAIRTARFCGHIAAWLPTPDI